MIIQGFSSSLRFPPLEPLLSLFSPFASLLSSIVKIYRFLLPALGLVAGLYLGSGDLISDIPRLDKSIYEQRGMPSGDGDEFNQENNLTFLDVDQTYQALTNPAQLWKEAIVCSVSTASALQANPSHKSLAPGEGGQEDDVLPKSSRCQRSP